MFVCSRYIITVCTSIRATSLYTEDEGERRRLPEGIPGITLLCLSVVDILLLSVPVSELSVYIQKMKERRDGSQKEFQVSYIHSSKLKQKLMPFRINSMYKIVNVVMNIFNRGIIFPCHITFHLLYNS